MGYETYYMLEVYDHDGECALSETRLEVYGRLERLSGYGAALFVSPQSWHTIERDMTRLSREYPHLYLRIDGSGDYEGDIWSKVWKNGKLKGDWQMEEILRPSLGELLADKYFKTH